jgi:hypothetical protein
MYFLIGECFLTTVYDVVVAYMTIVFQFGGALWSILGVIRLGSALKDKNGPHMQAAIWQILGGVSVIVSAILFRTFNIDFPLIISLLTAASKIVVIIGVLWSIYGVIILGDSVKNMNSPNLEASIWQIIGGILICLAGVLLNNIVKYNI